MSGLLRLRSVPQLVGRVLPCSKTKIGPAALNLCRAVETSGAQKSESHTTVAETESKPKKYWVSFGYCNTDQQLDKDLMHLSFFVIVSLFFTFGTFTLMYMPDFRLKDWALREAYLELRRRESLGLPPIDPNIIDPTKVILPTDEELGDAEIII